MLSIFEALTFLTSISWYGFAHLTKFSATDAHLFIFVIVSLNAKELTSSCVIFKVSVDSAAVIVMSINTSFSFFI